MKSPSVTGKSDVFGGTEWIKSQRILETSDDNCEAQRVEPRLQKHQIIGERCQFLALLAGDLLQIELLSWSD